MEDLSYWEHDYNWDKHSSLGGKTPLHDEISAKYDLKKEHILVHAYNKNFEVKKLKQSL